MTHSPSIKNNRKVVSPSKKFAHNNCKHSFYFSGLEGGSKERVIWKLGQTIFLKNPGQVKSTLYILKKFSEIDSSHFMSFLAWNSLKMVSQNVKL